MEKDEAVKKPRILCLHGHGVSAEIMKEELKRWPEFVLEKMDLVYINAPFPVDDSGLHYEWFHANEDLSEFWKFDECMAYIEDNMVKLGPFDGILGVSQGALVAAASPGMQSEGVALTKVPKIKFVIIISGGKFGGSVFSSPELAKNAFSSPIEIPSLHFIGEHDFTKENGLELLEAFVDPTMIYHHEGHGVPHLDEEGLKIILNFLEKIQKLLLG